MLALIILYCGLTSHVAAAAIRTMIAEEDEEGRKLTLGADEKAAKPERRKGNEINKITSWRQDWETRLKVW